MQESAYRIHLLADSLIDQIAAGEVVERPASVVKELVENALDADARRIRVEVRDGGMQLVAVSDDGCGMSPGDARLSLQRHATSKIASAADLEQIRSFGFRGEALPAIASVSRLRLRTRPRGAGEGWELRVEGGRLIEERAAGGPEGTRVEVADLFASVPARRKFLKKASTEWGHIADWLCRLGLALPGVHFEVLRDDREAFVWPVTAAPLDRIAAVLSEAVAGRLVRAEGEGPEGHLEAWLSDPEHSRANAGGLYLFVNGRPVRDTVLRHALLDAYRDLLPRGRFPTAVLFLTLPPAALDVNVHPAKWEVRFSDPRGIHRLVRQGVRQAMSERRWLDTTARDPARPPPPARTSPGASEGRQGYGGSNRSAAPARVSEGPAGAGDWVFARQPELAVDGARSDTAGAAGKPGVDAAEEPLHFGSLRLVGQLLASYLLVEGKRGLILVDQHAAHERVLYEHLRAQWVERGVSRQPLLVPESVEMDPLALAALAADAPRVERLGFEIDAFGEGAVVVRAIPALLSGRNPATLVRGLAEELDAPDGRGPGAEGSADVRLLRAADRIFATLACHAARRFGDQLEPAEQSSILRGLDEIPWAPTCPHGRPVAVQLDASEIERRFGRR